MKNYDGISDTDLNLKLIEAERLKKDFGASGSPDKALYTQEVKEIKNELRARELLRMKPKELQKYLLKTLLEKSILI